MQQRRAFKGQLVALAVEGRIEQQVRQQRLVEKAAREIMGEGRLAKPLAALDLDLMAIERGVERRRRRIVLEFVVAEIGFERRLDLIAERERGEETAGVEQRRGVEPLAAADLQIMGERFDFARRRRGGARDSRRRRTADADRRPPSRLRAHNRAADRPAASRSTSAIEIGREQRRRADALAPSGEHIMQQRIGDRLLGLEQPVEIVERIEQRRDRRRVAFDRLRHGYRSLDIGEKFGREPARRARLRPRRAPARRHARRANAAHGLRAPPPCASAPRATETPLARLHRR